jgi:hypothetical protein
MHLEYQSAQFCKPPAEKDLWDIPDLRVGWKVKTNAQHRKNTGEAAPGAASGGMKSQDEVAG